MLNAAVAETPNRRLAECPCTTAATIGGLRFGYSAQLATSVSSGSGSSHEAHHSVVVIRRAATRVIEVDVGGGRPSRIVPRPATVWVIPVGCDPRVRGGGADIEVCEIAVPSERGVTTIPRSPLTRQDAFLYQLTERIRGLINRSDPVARLLKESLAQTVRLHLIEHYFVESRPPRHHNGALTATARAGIVEYLDSNLGTYISLATLAKLAQMPEKEFGKAFTLAFGTTPYQFLLDRRIGRAKVLLATTASSVTDISAAVGFSNPSHFATTFKGRVGVTATAYRRGA